MTSEEYIDLTNKLYTLIMSEVELTTSSNSDLAPVYPKIVIMYEFFRLLRGEAFNNTRPNTPGHQEKLYEMENKIREGLEKIKDKLNPQNERTRAYMNEMLAPYLK